MRYCFAFDVSRPKGLDLFSSRVKASLILSLIYEHLNACAPLPEGAVTGAGSTEIRETKHIKYRYLLRCFFLIKYTLHSENPTVRYFWYRSDLGCSKSG